MPIIKTTNVCIVIGTGQGTCTFDDNAKNKVPIKIIEIFLK